MILDFTQLPLRRQRTFVLMTLLVLHQSMFASAWSIMMQSNSKSTITTYGNHPLLVRPPQSASMFTNPHLTQPLSSKSSTASFVSSGFSFEDGEQILVSVQKPLGIILEQDDGDADDGYEQNQTAEITVADVDPNGSAGRAGVRIGDILVAVQNASVEDQPLEYAMEILARAPQVVNLRFVR
mmetsp:Transcript_25041/g.35045  ORF Transcript_25041/g.35045 Transcript_25041/m.35045 type:complete len:182 (+) Transcript_25041:129-674(+)